MSKKAVELSMNAIIIAAIAILVLIVIGLIFTGQIGKFTKGMNDCTKKGGIPPCSNSESECIDKGGIPSGECVFYTGGVQDSRTQKDKVCCVFRK